MQVTVQETCWVFVGHSNWRHDVCSEIVQMIDAVTRSNMTERIKPSIVKNAFRLGPVRWEARRVVASVRSYSMI